LTRAFPVAWIRPLAAPYLRGYRALRARGGSLSGYWFLSRGQPPLDARGRSGRSPAAGFFVGYLLEAGGFEALSPEPPECLVFVFVAPPGGALHRRLVARESSLVRRTFDYIRWLTHRPPRFAFFDDQLPAMVRHRPMRDWPRAKWGHYARNFFIETLAWLVRSALVRRLGDEPQPRR
jgi:hypothetical protein